jgi:hypothetical protein
MTYEDFSNRFKKTNSHDKIWNYFISLTVICLGLFFLYLLHFTQWYDPQKVTTKNATPIWGINVFCGLLILLGLYGFWRIPKSYEMTAIQSALSIDKKHQIINQIISDFKLNELERGEQYRHFRYEGRFWNTFDIYIFYDTENFYLNAQQRDFGNDGGFIDFGTSKRVTTKIKNKIMALAPKPYQQL